MYTCTLAHPLATLEMVRGCCCCWWCVQSTPVEPRAVRSIEARGYYTFLGGGHPAPCLCLALSATPWSSWRATFCAIPGPAVPAPLFLRINRARDRDLGQRSVEICVDFNGVRSGDFFEESALRQNLRSVLRLCGNFGFRSGGR